MISGNLNTTIGDVKQVGTKLNSNDFWGAVKVRWLIGRDNYIVAPGLYAVGTPTNLSDVFVTANYKLSFDHLRKNLHGLNAWILVLDTKGVNVWCAAGKGTFGTRELVKRIKETRLKDLVSHNRIIVPQLGATGVSAHLVKKLTQSKNECCSNNSSPNNFSGFRVVFGPVQACDIKDFIKNNYKSTDEMRRVNFGLVDRLKLLPVDIVYAKKKLFAAFLLIFILSGISQSGFSFTFALNNSLTATLYISIAYFTGIFLTPILLPYIPVRMFAFKGLIVGAIVTIILLGIKNMEYSLLEIVAWCLLIPAVSSFMAMNFTGSSTFTSLSGVKREMKVFVPIQITMTVVGLVIYSINSYNLSL